jgi:signal transduction histidine kinase
MRVKDTENKLIGVIGAGQDISQHVQSKKKLLKEKFNLIDQNKSLKCLYQITQVFENSEITEEEMFQAVADMLPPAFHFNEIAAAKVIIDEKVYTAGEFLDSKHKISEKIIVNETIRGKVEIVYHEGDFHLKSQPVIFLEEEQNLLRTIVQQISFFLKKKEVNNKQLELERQLLHADRLATVGQLAAGIAHEINGPLTNILGYAQLSSKQEDLPEQVYQDLDNIVRLSLHAREIVKKVMLFSRQMPPKHSKVNLNNIITESLYFTEPVCSKTDVDVVCDLLPNLPEIMADSSQIHQIIVNLIVNAVQAMPKGGGKIFVKTYIISDNAVGLTIEDNGAGMSSETLMQCFMPFFTTKDVDQGTGLGLSVVHGIIQSHGGNIEVFSNEGEGARFDIMFPVTIRKEENNGKTE